MIPLLLACAKPAPQGIEDMLGFDQPFACGDLDFGIDTSFGDPDAPEDGGRLAIHVDGNPLAALAASGLASGKTDTVFVDLELFPMTVQWLEGSGRRGSGVCSDGSGTPQDVFDVKVSEPELVLVPFHDDASLVSKDCAVVKAIAVLVNKTQFGFEPAATLTHIKSGRTLEWENLFTIGIPVPCVE